MFFVFFVFVMFLRQHEAGAGQGKDVVVDIVCHTHLVHVAAFTDAAKATGDQGRRFVEYGGLRRVVFALLLLLMMLLLLLLLMRIIIL